MEDKVKVEKQVLYYVEDIPFNTEEEANNFINSGEYKTFKLTNELNAIERELQYMNIRDMSRVEFLIIKRKEIKDKLENGK